MVIRKNPRPTNIPPVPIYLSDEQWLAIIDFFTDNDGAYGGRGAWVGYLKNRFESHPFTTKQIK